MTREDMFKLMVKQPDKHLNPKIRSEGCYYLSILAIYQLESKYVLSAEEINTIYEQSVKQGAMLEDCFINVGGGEMIYQITSELTGKVVKGYHVANFKSGIWAPKKDNWKHAPNHCIIQFHRDLGRKRYYHFVYGDFKGNVLFDPIPNSKTVQFGVINSSRLYWAEKEEE